MNFDIESTFEYEYEDDLYTIDFYADGTHQEPFKGSALNCDSDIDYYGFTEINSIELVLVSRTDEDGKEHFVDFDKVPEKVLDELEDFVQDNIEALIEEYNDEY